ncbi:MAG: glycosyltransferase family 39 protein [candidate division WOR-3 bacterium]|nr:glycosyltransferase family 39 protein [candidate division WOR-3 bacterium]
MNFLKRKKEYTLLVLLIIIIATYLRFTGFNWALPQKPYYRAGYQDEAFVINMILTMNPKDYNPHYFINPTFHYYILLLATKLSHALGYIKNFSQPVMTNLQGHPIEKMTLNDYQKMYEVCRLIAIIEGILTVLLLYFIGKKLYDEKTGIFTAFIFSILPTHVFQSHFFVVDAPAVFWEMLCFYYLVKVVDKNGISKKWFIISGILLGLALGTKYMNLLLIFPFLTINLLSRRKIELKELLITFTIMMLVFLFTTPHSILSWREFLFGNPDGFGGIFGEKGLFAYNRYPTNPFKPFIYVIYYSLRIPLAVLAFISLGYVIYRRNTSDKIILSFLVPFYVIMAISPSPHLRHALPALPFLAIAIATSIISLARVIKNRFLLYSFAGFTAIALIYTFLFTIAMLDRMNLPDTRLVAADWIFKNIPARTPFGVATVMPFRYTPPIEMPGYDGNDFGPTDEKILLNLYYIFIKTNYDYYSLLHFCPEYFLISQVECEELPYNEVGEVNGRNFIRQLFSQKHYKLIKIFERKFNILGFKFHPDFPNLDWNPVSQKIYLFKKNFNPD